MSASVKLIVAVALPLAVGALTGAATSHGVATWYPTLVKPSFTPPSWVFAPVWTALYVLMGVASFLVWQRGPAAPAVRGAIAAYLVQLALNGLWSLVFFGWRQPGWALAEIVLLWLALAVTVGLFWRVRAIAGGLLVPYLAWVSFAAVLNGALWWLNR